jgi:hypothetical protein
MTVAPAGVPAPDFPPSDPIASRCRRHRVLGLVLIFLVFLGGAVTGLSLGVLFHWYHRPPDPLRSPEKAPERFLAKFRSHFTLTAEQDARIEPLVRNHCARLEAIRVQVYPQIKTELDEFEQAISAVLDEPQRTKWTEDFAEMRNRGFPPPSVAPPKLADEEPKKK